MAGGAVHVEHFGEIGLVVKTHNPVGGVSFSFAVESPDFGVVRSVNDVQVRQDLSGADEKSAAGHLDFIFGVVGDDGDDRRFDAAD